jgi:hypothetical protein
MDCRQVQDAMKIWEKSGSLEEGVIPQLEVHIESCKTCKKKYSGLLPFIFRDGGDVSGLSMALDDTTSDLKEVKKKLLKTEKKKKAAPLIIGALIIGMAVLAGVLVFFLLQPGLEENMVQHEFTLLAPEARTVELMGDFTEWEKHKIAMEGPDANGTWKTAVKLEKGKVYKYNFIINGVQSIADPTSPYEVDDGFGGVSSLLQL